MALFKCRDLAGFDSYLSVWSQWSWSFSDKCRPTLKGNQFNEPQWGDWVPMDVRLCVLENKHKGFPPMCSSCIDLYITGHNKQMLKCCSLVTVFIFKPSCSVLFWLIIFDLCPGSLRPQCCTLTTDFFKGFFNIFIYQTNTINNI